MFRCMACAGGALLFLLLGASSAASPTLKQIIATPSLLKDNYKVETDFNLDVDGIPLKVERCVLGETNDTGVFRLQFQGKQLVLPYREITYLRDGPVTGLAPEPIVLINNGEGGNAWNANQYYVVSLGKKTPLKLLGLISHLEELDGGQLSLRVSDDIWEDGLGVLCHADSPGARVYMQVKAGRLERDLEKTRAEAQQRITETFDREIRKLKFWMDDPAEPSEPLLRAILSRFLHYRVMGEQEKGWEILKEDLATFPRKSVKNMLMKDEPIPVLEAKIAESVKQNPLDKWLKKITSVSFDSY